MLIDISLACGDAVGREVQVRDLARAELIIRMLDFVEDMLPNVRMARRANTERVGRVIFSQSE